MKALLLVFLIGCGGVPMTRDTLSDSVRSYNDGVRWERFQMAAVHIPPKQRVQFVDEADDRAKDLKITQYDIVAVEAKGERAAKVHIKLEWYTEREGTIHETHALQTWEKHGHDWLLVEEARLRGPEMPGLPEPVAKPEEKTRSGPTSMTP